MSSKSAIRPPSSFVSIPAGSFKMGSDKATDAEAYENELPQHEVTLPAYLIGKHPVTVGEFRAYLKATKRQPPHPSTLASPANHPVTHVSWHDAVAYCEWMTTKMRMSPKTPKAIKALLAKSWKVFLPTEAQWEKAARGTDGRIYPWGNTFDEKRLNFGYRVGKTTPVDKYKKGASPYGALDMAGNVWEWTRSPWAAKYPLPAHSDAATSAAPLRGTRGGSFFNISLVRCASRLGANPDDRNLNLGFRVALSPF